MPDLPRISEDFTADASGYLAALQEMIDKTQELVAEVQALHEEINDLPDVKNIEVNVVGNAVETIAAIKDDLDGLDSRTVEVNVVYKNVGSPDVHGGSVTETVKVATEGGNVNWQEEANNLNQVADAAERATAGVDEVAAANDRAGAAADLLAASQQLAERAMNDTSLSSRQQIDMLQAASTASREYRNAMAEMAAQAGESEAQLDAFMESLHNEAEQLTTAMAEQRAELEEITAAEEKYGTSISWIQDVQEKVRMDILDTKVAQDEAAASLDELEASVNDVSGAYERQMAVTASGINTDRLYAQTQDLLAGTNLVLSDSFGRTNTAIETLTASLKNAGDDGSFFRAQLDQGVPTMLAFAMAAKNAGDNVGGMLIPLTAASFGITGMGTAIHLMVMGVFEFAAVFVPAMYAAAAGAAVLVQGASYVVTGLKSIYEVGESLGPMLGETQGDMLGLGHSLQIAQNAADPLAYELLGAAIRGVNEITGTTSTNLGNVTHNAGGAADQISKFGQAGLAVSNILDQFGAKLDVDLGSNMGEVDSVLSKAVEDLVMFGQILGNVGHAILNLAADMPGLAEIILKVIDGFSDLVKWVSSLNPVFIAVVMGFEEAYRWSGLLAGAIGVLSRGIALLGTLGLPIIAKIGMNMGAAAASVITGVQGMIINFSALTSKIGNVGEAMSSDLEKGAMSAAEEGAIMAGSFVVVDDAAQGVTGALGKAAEFMTGPWGAAVMIGVAGFTALAIWALHAKSATDQFIDSANKAVSSASNLNVLNVIGQQMLATNQKLATANTEVAHSLDLTAGATAGVSSRYNGMSQAYSEAAGSAQALTGEQQKLFTQANNTIQGAQLLSKTYGVDFTGALGLADLAGVKLANGITGQSQAAQQARLQIANLELGYQKMDQTGGILGNTMNAVNIEASIQASEVSKVNQAWDQFIAMSTSLTGSFSQFNLDLEQMGNNAQVVGAKITAFTGTTQLSVSQIATALKSFSGNSAQVWQSYNQSITQANTFMDSLRTAADAGVVSQTQFGQAAASVVKQMVPYASSSKAALSELMAIASEAGGPAYDATKSFAANLQNLKNWTDKNAVSSNQFTGMIDTMTAKLSNVTTVAKQFASTLQTDVLNAIAQAGVSTAGITGLTQKYTQALTQNGAGAQQTTAAQTAFNGELQKLGFTHQQVTQLDQELTTAYGKNTDASGGATTGTSQLNKMLQTMKNEGLIPADESVAQLAHDLGVNLNNATNTAGGTAGKTASGPMTALKKAEDAIYSATNAAVGALGKWPSSEHTTFGISGSGTVSIGSGVSGVAGGHVFLTAEGGVMPGYAPGHDTIPAMLSPGEGVLIPEAVRGLGGAGAINSLNKSFRSARHFADGGVAEISPKFAEAGGSVDMTSQTVINNSVQKVAQEVAAKIAAAQKAALAAAAAAAASLHPTGAGATVEKLMESMAASVGWTGAQLTALLDVEAREAGFNTSAKNPSSGAYGLAQFINGAGEYAQYGGNANTAAGQITAMFNYIKDRYGTPEGAWAHEQSYGWYDQGGWLMPGMNIAYNGTGQPEKVTSPTGFGPGDGGIAPIQVHIDGKKVFEAMAPYSYQKSSRNNGNANAGRYYAPGSGRQGT